MNGIKSYFTSSSTIPGGVTLLSRQEDSPVPYFLSLINLIDLGEIIDTPPGEDQLLLNLSPRERDIYADFSYPKRKREWLGGRLAAKYATLTLLDQEQSHSRFADLAVLPQENGAPMIHSSCIPADIIPALSISHSENYAVAMVVKAEACGIDIQKISDKTERVADRFCDAEELSLLHERAPQLSITEQLTMLWSAKEALKKALLHDQPVIFQGVTLRSLEIDKHFTLHLAFPAVLKNHTEITVVKLEEYMLAFTIERSVDA